MILREPPCHEQDLATPTSKSSWTAPMPNSPVRCTVYGPRAFPNGLRALADEWNQLLARSRCDLFFLTHEWQSVWWQQLGEGELWILAFRETQGDRLVGIAPFYRVLNQEGPWAGKVSFHWVGCIEVSDYLDVIAARGWEQAIYCGLLAWLQSHEAPQWDVLDLCNLPEESLTHRMLPRIFRAAGYPVEVTQEDIAPSITLPARYEDYLSSLDKKQRHEIRRKQRRAERDLDVGFYFVGPEHDLQREMDGFIALQRMSRPDKEEFMTPEMERFFRVMAQRMLDTGHLRLSFLTFNGEKAATLFSFAYKQRMLLYNSGYDTGKWAQYSPGWVLLAYAIQHAIACGMHIFDFMQGDEEYKYRFGGQDYRVMRTVVYNTDAQEPTMWTQD